MQARLKSHRLPDKALLPLVKDETVLDVVLHNLYGCADVHILACPTNCIEQFSPIAEKHSYKIVVGPEENVLTRVYLAYQTFPASWIIRATADNPIISADLAKKLLKNSQKYNADYGCYKNTPVGGSVQILSKNALIIANEEAKNPDDRKHVCPFIINHPKRFKLYTPIAPKYWRGNTLRATIDFIKDYNYIRKFYENYYQKESDVLKEFITWTKQK